jgi:hypothetical protein
MPKSMNSIALKCPRRFLRKNKCFNGSTRFSKIKIRWN